MKFEQVIPALRAGMKVRRSGWYEGAYIYLRREGTILDDTGHEYDVATGLFSDEWEIVTESRELSWEEITRAVQEHVKYMYPYGSDAPHDFTDWKAIKKQLGFSDD